MASGYWGDDGSAWVIRHHGPVILSSLAAQTAKRDRDRKAQQRHREKQRGISADASAYQADRQTDRRSKGSGGEQPSPDWALICQMVRIVHADPCGGIHREHLAERLDSRGFDARWRASAGGRELERVRNFKPAFKRGLWTGLLNAGWETLTGGKSPWTLHNSADWSRLEKLDAYTAPDRHWGERTLPPRDRVSFVFFAGNAHEESQPVHLKVADTDICVQRCAREYGNPCERFCPAGVYEMVDDGQGGRRLQINAANCVHCKACDIKDPYEIITWTTPEGGSGPNYQSL